MSNPNRVILDTNVLNTAKGISNAGKACMDACVDKLIEIMTEESNHIVVLDDQWIILTEYGNKMSDSGDNLGDEFYKWLLTFQFNPDICERVTITEVGEHEFKEVKDLSESLNKAIDPSDRKFVAVALAHNDKPPIVNAVDSDWRKVEAELNNHGVRIEFICQAEMDKPRQPRISRRVQRRENRKENKKKG